MKNRKFFAALCAMLMLCAALVSCGKKDAYAPGTITENGYESEWLGIRYTATEGMVMATEDEIKAAMEGGTEMLYEDDKEIDYDAMTNIYEMMATNSSTGESLNMITEKLATKAIDEEAYAEAVELQLQQMDGATITLLDTDEREIAGIEFMELSYSMEVQGITLYQSMFLEQKGERMVVMTASYFDPANLDAMLAGFSAL